MLGAPRNPMLGAPRNPMPGAPRNPMLGAPRNPMLGAPRNPMLGIRGNHPLACRPCSAPPEAAAASAEAATASAKTTTAMKTAAAVATPAAVATATVGRSKRCPVNSENCDGKNEAKNPQDTRFAFHGRSTPWMEPRGELSSFYDDHGQVVQADSLGAHVFPNVEPRTGPRHSKSSRNS